MTVMRWPAVGVADAQLSAQAGELIRSTTNEVLVSAASLLEIAIKIKIGKLDIQRTSTEIAQEMKGKLAIELLPILPHQLDAYELIPLYEDHRDPVDRLLIATALAEDFGRQQVCALHYPNHAS